MSAPICPCSAFMLKPRRALGAIAVSVWCGSFGVPSEAQDRSGKELEEVIVSAQKLSERLQDVPVPVTAISAEALVEANQLRIQDYYTRVPGLGLALSGNGGEPVVNIRGITTGDFSNPTVGIVIDDAPFGASVVNPAAPDIDPSDLQRLEVLRGPQGTLYGASSIGGLLKFVTVDPSTEAMTGRIQVGGTSVRYGDDLGHQARGSINVPLGDSLALRASGFTTRDPGYVDNELTGEEDVNRRDSEGGRISALWRPSETFSVRLSALVQRTERLGTQDIDLALAGEPRQRSLAGTGTYKRDAQAYSATVSGSIGEVDLTSVTGYNIDELGTNLDLSGNAFQAGLAERFFGVRGVSVPLFHEVKKLTQEVRASVPISDGLTWLLGGFYTDEDIDRGNDVVAANPATGAVAGRLLRNALPTTYEEYAFFTNLTAEFTDRFDVQFGGRVSENKQQFSIIRSGPSSTVFFGVDPFASPEVTAKDTPVTYLVTPRLKITPDFMLYARVASGYRPGGPNINCGAVSIPCEFDPDTTQNYEVGFKGSALSGTLQFDASIYYIDWKDIQVSIFANGLGYTDNASRAKSEGIELSIESRPVDGLTISAWAAYSNAELTENFPPGTGGGRAGDRLPYSSRFSGTISADQAFPLWSNADGFVGASVSRVGDRRGLFRTTTQVRESFPAYTQFDLRTGFHYEAWSLEAFLTNVSNERGILRAGLDALSPTYVTYIQPRTIGLSFAKNF